MDSLCRRIQRSSRARKHLPGVQSAAPTNRERQCHAIYRSPFRCRHNPSDRIEVATSGFTFEQLAILKESFVRIRDSALSGSSIPKIAIAIEALEKISWRVSGVKHHGVLMFAERGLNLRLPEILSTAATEPTYTTILTAWTEEIFALFQDNSLQPETVVKLTDYGRIESLWSSKRQNGIVIGAPHGTFEEHTAEMANEVSHRTGIAAVIARAFTPTECGDGASTSIAPPSDSIRRTVSKSFRAGARCLSSFQTKRIGSFTRQLKSLRRHPPERPAEEYRNRNRGNFKGGSPDHQEDLSRSSGSSSGVDTGSNISRFTHLTNRQRRNWRLGRQSSRHPGVSAQESTL